MAARRRDTDGYICVLVEDDLKEMRREDGRGFEVLLWSEDVLLLPVRSWGRAGQICKQTRVNTGLFTGTPLFGYVIKPVSESSLFLHIFFLPTLYYSDIFYMNTV